MDSLSRFSCIEELNVLFQNYPLFLRTVSPEEELKFHYTVHTSLDVVEEKGKELSKVLLKVKLIKFVLHLRNPCHQWSNLTVCDGKKHLI